MIEQWTDIEGYEGKYILSNTGKVVSLNYNNTGKPRELKPKINQKGYLEVKLSRNNKTKNFLVSTLVGKHFLENKNFKDNIILKTKDKTKVSVDNLKWAYFSERQHNAYNKGSRKESKGTKTKITYNGKNYKSYEEIRRDYNINQNTFEQRYYIRGWSLKEAIEVPIGRR